ncbi:hypothetical protein [Marinobacterium arenosum]|uniref:hypothetical protein n=1 Tax=Marinobacterium arenosum TaxID=2862496 RepID=UPI001C96AE8A|nr:hypothetical protein [Marinobacterium arenosum]MBY4677644.1 hypothetical protein [Marinobacterium arenosum]
MKSIKPLLPLLLTGSLAACASNAPEQASQAPAAVQHTQLGSVWRTADGNTLYTFAKDQPGQSNCYGPCAEKWPPFIASGDAAPSGEFGLIERKDGSRQWTYRNQPLYSWIKDRQAGDTTGHGVKNIWFVARADEVPVKVYQTANASILTDNRQQSLYTFDKDKAGESNCYGKCATLWPPLQAAQNAKASAPFNIVERRDGSYQWALNGKPLYTWIKDSKPGDISGDGVKGVWHLAHQPGN